jgi:hypothetical protein
MLKPFLIAQVLSGIVLIAEQRFRAIPICVRVSAPPSAITAGFAPPVDIYEDEHNIT